jgi:hypothetical protein
MHEGLGLPGPPDDRRDWNAMNSTLHGIWGQAPLEEVRQQLRDGFESVLAALEGLSEGKLRAGYLDRAAPEGVTIMDVVSANTYEHFMEHETWVREQLEQTGRLPD